MRVKTLVRVAFLIVILIGFIHPVKAETKTFLYYSCDPAVVFNDGKTRIAIEVATTRQGITDVRIGSGTNPLAMYDDGSHGDRVAGDGIYTLGDYLVPGGWLLPFGDSFDTWNPIVTIHKNDGTTEQAPIGIGLVNPDLRFPVARMAANVYASDSALFIVDPTGQTLDATIPLGAIKCGKTAFGAFQKLYSVFPDVFDFVIVMPGGAVFDPARQYAENVPYFVRAKNDVRNIGVPLFNNTAAFGSAGRLMGMIYHSWGVGSILDHEIGHAWSASQGQSLGISHCTDCSGDHWNPLTDIGGQMSAFLFHPDVPSGAGHLFSNGDGTWRIERENDDAARYSILDLYAMGLIPAEQVPDVHKLINPNITDDRRVTAERVETYTIQQIMQASGGARVPSFQQSPKQFNVAFIAIKNKAFTEAEYSFYSVAARQFASRRSGARNLTTFYEATGHRGRLNAALPLGRSHFAQFGNGGGLTSSVVLANPSGTQTADGQVKFTDESGRGMAVSVNGNPASDVASFSIMPFGAARLTTNGAGAVSVGSARVVSNVQLGSVVCFSVPGFGLTGVGESEPLRRFAIPVVRIAQQLNTGVALLNVEDYPVELDLALRRQDGVQATGGAASRTLEPGAHLAQFVHELFPGANTDSFSGSLWVSVKTEGGRVAAAAIQQGVSAGQFTTLPVVAVDPPASAKTLYFPQFGSGQGLASSLFLANPSESTVTGQVSCYSDEGNALALSINGGASTNTYSFTLAPYGSTVLETSGSGALASGSARVVTDIAIGGVLRFSITGLGIAGVAAAAPANSVIVPVSNSASRRVGTGVAITAPTGAQVTLTLRDTNGQGVTGGVRSITLAANGHTARYIPELFPGADTREFEGTVTVTSTGGQIAATAIELGSAPGQFTAFPVTQTR